MTLAKKFRWDDTKSEELSPLISRRPIQGDRARVASINLKKETAVPEHHHQSEEPSQVTKGEILFELDGKKIDVKGGEVLVIPPNKPHKATAIEDTVDIDLISPIREGWVSGKDR